MHWAPVPFFALGRRPQLGAHARCWWAGGWQHHPCPHRRHDIHVLSRVPLWPLTACYWMSCCGKMKAIFNGFAICCAFFLLRRCHGILILQEVLVQKNEGHIQRISVFLRVFSSMALPGHSFTAGGRGAEERRPYSTDSDFCCSVSLLQLCHDILLLKKKDRRGEGEGDSPAGLTPISDLPQNEQEP